MINYLVIFMWWSFNQTYFYDIHKYKNEGFEESYYYIFKYYDLIYIHTRFTCQTSRVFLKKDIKYKIIYSII